MSVASMVAAARPRRLSRLRRPLGAVAVAAALAVGMTSGTSAAETAAPAADPAFKALVFSKTTGFRHDSIPDGIAAIQKLGQENNFTVDVTEDSTVFTDANLAQYKVVIFLSTTGEPLGTQEEKDAFQRYIQQGGGYAGIHAAADSSYSWGWYGDLVGAYFKQHPAVQQATVKVEDPAHPSTKDLPTTWSRTDEWYDYQTNPRGKVHVLTSLDEKTYTGGSMGFDHPNTWCQDYDGGRSWYTGLGHSKESFVEPEFLKLLLGGIQTSAGVVPADCSASQDTSFEKVTLDDNTSNPMMLDVASDGRVFYIDRLGDVKVVQSSGAVVTAGHLNVFTANESGLIGMALDPGFVTNNWIYLYYSPLNGGDIDRLSRFTVKPDSTLDMASEKVLLEIPVQRSQCCHHGGGMVFDKETGDLWLANGDNTNPFASDNYTPIDERAGRSDWDAQKSSSNTNDLRGKVLRIHPEDDGSYTIPEGNLFPPGTAKTRPEIYGMGFRNPFRIGIDPKTRKLMVGDYGPDARTANPSRGPENTVEWNILNQPGNYGWPYCIGNNAAYNEYDFATGVSGPKYDCANPVNNSPNNTGLVELPPAIPATVSYHYEPGSEFPELGGGGGPMAGPVYRYDANLASDRKWPAYWDGKAIFAEWNQSKMYSFQLNEDGSKLVDINQILKSFTMLKPMDMKFGPDGALYLIEWGSGFGGDNADSGVYRIDYVNGNRAPIARAKADRTSGIAPLSVNFSGDGSLDPDGTPVTYAWDFTGDGTTDSTEANPSHTYTTNGNFSATLTVTDADGRTATANVPIVVGNTAPTVKLNLPPNGGFFDWGDQVKFSITVTDPEDGTINCDDVRLQSILGHDTHGHPLDQYTGCAGTVQTTLASGHSAGDNVFAVVEASYTDKGGAGGAAPLTGRAQSILQPKRKQAEFFTATGRTTDGQGTGDPGVQVETTSDTAGGFRDIGSIEDGDWWSFDPVNLSAVDSIGFRVASGGGGGTIEVRSGGTDGPLVGTVAAPQTGDWQSFTNVTLPLGNPPTETAPLYFVARRPSGSTNTGGLFNVNWVDFNGKGVTDNQRPEVTASGTPTRGTAPLTVAFRATATDAEGDNPLTYQWNFGVNGAGATTPDASYTYTTPGNYEASVTVTDSRGAATTEYVEVTVDSPSVTCLTGKSDDFLGTTLDSGRWTVVRQNQDLAVRDGGLHIPTSNTDIYGSDNSAATPNLVLQPAPSGAWQATTKVSLTARDAYQQAGLILYGDDDNYAKMVLEGRGTASAADRVFQFIREEKGVPNEVTESNTANLGAGYPDTVYVRLASDGTRLTASYSADGLSWTTMPETDKLIAGIDNPRIGLVALSGTGNRPVVDAAFDWFQLVPDDTATAATPNDEFDGSGVDGCRWTTVVRPDATKTRVTGGNLEIDTTPGDIYGTDNSGPKNFTLQTPPAGDWSVETKVDASALSQAYQQAGLIVYTDDANYVKLDFVADSATSKRIELRGEIGDVVGDPQPTANNLTQGVWYLRLAKTGNAYKGSYSSDGVTWTDLAQTVTNAAVSSGKVGLFAIGTNATQLATAKFDYFHASWAQQADETAPVTTATTDPGARDWFTGPVTVTLSAVDDESGLDRTEYTVDGGAWTPYTAPFAVSGDKAHTVGYRSVDKAGNTEAAKSLAISVDATAPLTTAAFAAPNDNGWHAGAIPVTLAATDATSGVAGTEYALDGGPWTAYTQPVDVSGDGTHTVAYRSRDKAGNVETEKAATVKIDGTAPTVLVSGIADRQVYGDGQDLRISWQAVDPTSGVATLTGSLDGGSVASGTLLPLYTVSLGTHSLTVTAVDKAGNRTSQQVTFGVSTSTRDLANLIDRFKAVGWLNQATQKSLQEGLTKVRKAEASGNDAKTIKLLREFRTLATDQKKVTVAEVRDTLARDVDDLIARLS